jgi:hypothetical protein
MEDNVISLDGKGPSLDKPRLIARQIDRILNGSMIPPEDEERLNAFKFGVMALEAYLKPELVKDQVYLSDRQRLNNAAVSTVQDEALKSLRLFAALSSALERSHLQQAEVIDIDASDDEE